MSGITDFALSQVARRWRNLAGLAVLALAATALFTATTALRQTVDDAFNARAEQASNPDLWIRTSGQNDALVAGAVEAGATTVLEVRPVLAGDQSPLQLATVVIDDPGWTEGRPIMLDGRAAASSGEVAIDHLLADQAEVSVGETVMIDAGTETMELTIVGEFVHTLAERAPFDPGLLMVHADARSSFPELGNRWLAMSRESFDRLIPELERQAFGTDVTVDVDDNAEFAQSHLGAITPMAIVLTAIGGLASVMVFVLIATLTTGQVMARRREFGITRALGWSTGHVRRLIVVEAAIPSAVGAVAGIPIGLLAARWLAKESTAPLALDPELPSPGLLSLVAACGVVLVCCLAALLGSATATRQSPADLIRLGRGLDSVSASGSRLVDVLAAVPVIGVAAHFALRPARRAALVLVSLIMAASLTSMVVHYDEVIDALESRAGVTQSEFLTVVADADVDLAAVVAGSASAQADVLRVFPDDDDEVNYEDVPAGTVAYGIELANTAGPVAVGDELSELTDGAIRVVDTGGGDIATLRAIRSAVRPVTAIVLVIGVAALVVMIGHRVREQRRDLAVLGAIGVTRANRLLMTASMALIPAVLAIVIGIPLGPLMLGFFMRMADGAQFVDLIQSPGAGWLAAIAVGFLATSVLVTLPIGLRLARLQPADALRHLD